MKSEEIKELLELKQFLITLQDYIKIFSTSPQIRNMQFDRENDMFILETDDRYKFRFQIEKEGGKRYGS